MVDFIACHVTRVRPITLRDSTMPCDDEATIKLNVSQYSACRTHLRSCRHHRRLFTTRWITYQMTCITGAETTRCARSNAPSPTTEVIRIGNTRLCCPISISERGHCRLHWSTAKSSDTKHEPLFAISTQRSSTACDETSGAAAWARKRTNGHSTPSNVSQSFDLYRCVYIGTIVNDCKTRLRQVLKRHLHDSHIL